MSLKSLVVFVEPSSVGESGVRYAVKVALHHHAHLIGVFIVPKAWDNEPADCYICGADAIRNMLVRHKTAEREALRLAGQVSRTRLATTISHMNSVSFAMVMQAISRGSIVCIPIS